VNAAHSNDVSGHCLHFSICHLLMVLSGSVRAKEAGMAATARVAVNVENIERGVECVRRVRLPV
jgi:hypothetical protein